MTTLATHWNVLTTSWAEETRRRKENRIHREAHEFLPAALEVLEKPPSPIGRLLIWGMMAFIAAAILWAAVGRLDVVASAPGKIIPADRVKLLQAADGGVVRAIHVRDGEMVRAGQILMELDPTQSGADAAQAQSALQTARVDKARAEALLRYARGGAAQFVAPSGTSAPAILAQQSMIASTIAELDARIADLDERRQENLALADMAGKERSKLEATLPLLKERVEKRKELTEKGLSSKLLQLELEQQQLGHERDIGVQADSARRYRALMASNAMQIREARQTFAKEAATLLAKAEDEIKLRSEELTKATQRSSLQQLKAPVDGTVQQISIHTLGAVVKPADPLLVIVPKDGALIVEAKVLNKDVGQVTLGQEVAVKLEAFPFTRYGTMPGTLINLSRDAVQDDAQQGQGLGLVYMARIKLNCGAVVQQSSAIKRKTSPIEKQMPNSAAAETPSELCTHIAPGMAATADIRTGTRSIMEFLLSPLARRAQEAGRER
jgi:hemolysin D